jgi:hypothetical protein
MPAVKVRGRGPAVSQGRTATSATAPQPPTSVWWRGTQVARRARRRGAAALLHAREPSSQRGVRAGSAHGTAQPPAQSAPARLAGGRPVRRAAPPPTTTTACQLTGRQVGLLPQAAARQHLGLEVNGGGVEHLQGGGVQKARGARGAWPMAGSGGGTALRGGIATAHGGNAGPHAGSAPRCRRGGSEGGRSGPGPRRAAPPHRRLGAVRALDLQRARHLNRVGLGPLPAGAFGGGRGPAS